jgi:hypothetical protein
MPSFFVVQDRTALVARLRALKPDSVRRWGSMTPNQMVCHLSDAFRGALGERPIPARGRLVHRTLIRWVAFNTPLPWPRGTPTVAEFDQKRGGTRPVGFERDRAELVAAIARFGAAGDRIDGAVHPLFGRMARREWDVWAWRHTDHHLRQFGL